MSITFGCFPLTQQLQLLWSPVMSSTCGMDSTKQHQLNSWCLVRVTVLVEAFSVQKPFHLNWSPLPKNLIQNSITTSVCRINHELAIILIHAHAIILIHVHVYHYVHNYCWCFHICRFAKETTSCRTLWRGWQARFNILTYFIFQVKNLKILSWTV